MPTDDTKPQRKLQRLKVHETSGVDHPAHLHPGWLVKKSVDSTTAEALSRALGKEMNMPDPKATPVLTSVLKSCTEATDLAAFRKAILDADSDVILKEITDADITPVKDMLAEAWKALRDLADKGSADTPSSDAAPAAVDAAQVLASADLQKAIGPQGVALLQGLQKAADESREKLEKAEIAGAVQLLKSEYGPVLELEDEGFDTLAKALRSMEPAAADAVRDALAKAKSLNDSAESIITKEIGGAGAVKAGSARDRMNTLAKAMQEADPKLTFEAAFLKACEGNPELYTQISQEA